MLVIMLCEPGCRFRLPKSGGPIDNTGKAPNIGVEKKRPTFIYARYFLRGNSARYHKAHDKIKQRLSQLRQIGGFRQPVIHLQINVDVVVGIPRRGDGVIPHTLQIRGQ